MQLAPYATLASASRGRLLKEPESQTRGAYQRDRDRIIHSGAFRRLRNKTQVFIESEGDYFRTRLTHSLEVAQIARTLARQLQVDEDLAEALALAHDLGHTCFGHAGEQALQQAMAGLGTFDHNDQTFRILTLLERRYAAFDGLNLSWEMLEGVVKHNGPLLPEKVGKKLPPTIQAFQSQWDLELSTFAGIEAQIAALADDIAYNTHDFDDGARANLFEIEELTGLPIFSGVVKEARAKYPKLEDDRMIHEIVRQSIGVLVDDVLQETKRRIAELKPNSTEAVRHAPKPLVAFSVGVEGGLNQLRHFLDERMYRHTRVNRMTSRARRMVKRLFDYFMAEPNVLPHSWYQELVMAGKLEDKTALARHVADYIAGMTDRFAELEYRRLFSHAPLLD